jgi:hypothetical protein
MATPIRDLQVALWTHLGNQSAYSTLALHEYRFYNGVLLPYDWQSGRIGGEALPAHSARIVDAGRESIEGDRKNQGTSRRWFVEVEATVIYSASLDSDTEAADRVDAFMSIIHDALDPRAKRQALEALLGGGQFAWSPKGGPVAGRNGQTAGVPRLWAWTWGIALYGSYQHA